MRECPECGQSVKLENMKRHFANVHPGKDASAAISDEEHREIRRAQRPGGRAFYSQRWFQIVLVILLISGIGYLGLPYILGAHLAAQDIVTYCGVEGSVEHYHPLLVIHDNGVQQPLPYQQGQGADIGAINQPGFTNAQYYCPGGEIHVLHTHDGSGIIHVELPFTPSAAPTLGQFFTIWGEPLTPAQVWTFSGHVTAQMYNSDTGQTTDYSANPTSIPLYVPAAGPQGGAYSIPPSLIFYQSASGTYPYGDGASGGTFSGEIIYLNVTA